MKAKYIVTILLAGATISGVAQSKQNAPQQAKENKQSTSPKQEKNNASSSKSTTVKQVPDAKTNNKAVIKPRN